MSYFKSVINSILSEGLDLSDEWYRKHVTKYPSKNLNGEYKVGDRIRIGFNFNDKIVSIRDSNDKVWAVSSVSKGGRGLYEVTEFLGDYIRR